ncbi:MAG: inositol monophosphatase family protein [Candidatus Binatia bacterium]|jgi:myo-inositol-1(or 4)-monophosphatase
MDGFEHLARTLVAEAGERLRAAWGEAKIVEHKGVVDIVTETDREIEALLTAELRRAFPDHLIVAEEASAGCALQRPPDERYVWYLDPLDGTINFAHGYPQFAVSLALARGRELLLGIVHDPVRRETFCARRGLGATLNDAPIRVSATDDIEQALIGTGFPYDRREHLDFYLRFLTDFMVRAQGVRRSGSAALDLSYVACGRLDGFWEWKLKPWDTAAGALLVEEAGGSISDFRGGPFDLFGQQTLASNGRLHRLMADTLAARLQQP